jgi:hypothetical protein
MTQQEILEGNKLIAEFMGYKQSVIIGVLFIHETKLNLTISELKYHSSWDWLMPVVGKIKECLKNGNYIDTRTTFLTIQHLSIFEDIETVYAAVVEFIKWHNANKS